MFCPLPPSPFPSSLARVNINTNTQDAGKKMLDKSGYSKKSHNHGAMYRIRKRIFCSNGKLCVSCVLFFCFRFLFVFIAAQLVLLVESDAKLCFNVCMHAKEQENNNAQRERERKRDGNQAEKVVVTNSNWRNAFENQFKNGARTPILLWYYFIQNCKRHNFPSIFISANMDHFRIGYACVCVMRVKLMHLFPSAFQFFIFYIEIVYRREENNWQAHQQRLLSSTPLNGIRYVFSSFHSFLLHPLFCSYKVFTIFRCLPLPLSLPVCVFHFRFRFVFDCIEFLLVFCLFLPRCICCRSPVASRRQTVYHKMGQRTGNFQLECTMLFNDNLRHIGWNFPVSAQTECIYCIELRYPYPWVSECVWCWYKFVVRLPNGFLPFDDAFHYFWIEFIAYTQCRPMISCCWCCYCHYFCCSCFSNFVYFIFQIKYWDQLDQKRIFFYRETNIIVCAIGELTNGPTRRDEKDGEYININRSRIHFHFIKLTESAWNYLPFESAKLGHHLELVASCRLYLYCALCMFLLERTPLIER